MGTSPNPSTGDPFSGETFGIPNGIQIPTLGLPGILLPSDGLQRTRMSQPE
jgi:hypothetical protein